MVETFSAKHQKNAVIRLIIKPNLALQHLTTREPDLEMLAVAISAFKQVIASEYNVNHQEPSSLAAEASAGD